MTWDQFDQAAFEVLTVFETTPDPKNLQAMIAAKMRETAGEPAKRTDPTPPADYNAPGCNCSIAQQHIGTHAVTCPAGQRELRARAEATPPAASDPSIMHDLETYVFPYTWRRMPDYDKVLEDVGAFIEGLRAAARAEGESAAYDELLRYAEKTDVRWGPSSYTQHIREAVGACKPTRKGE